MKHPTAAFFAAVISACFLAGCSPEPTPVEAHTPSQPARVATPARVAPTPTTAAGFQRMFDRLTVEEWGGGDVSTSVRIADGRTVWLYGDTVSRNHGIVNSSAIVQRGGTLHVSYGGRQLMPQAAPRNGRKTVWWIETARAAGGNRIEVTAALMSLDRNDVWGFRREAKLSRTSLLEVTPRGDVNYLRPTGWVPEPPVDKRLLGIWQGVPPQRAKDRGAVFYRKNAHRQFRLASGKTLHTICTNRMDGDLSDLTKYRPIFVEE